MVYRGFPHASISRRSLLTAIAASCLPLPLYAEDGGALDQSDNPLEAVSGPAGNYSRQGEFGQPEAGYNLTLRGTTSVTITMATPQKHINTEIPVVIIAHGKTQSPQSVWNIAAHLASHGFFVITPDLTRLSIQSAVHALHDVMRALPTLSNQTGYRIRATEAVFIASDDNADACIALTGGKINGVEGKKWIASCLVMTNATDDGLNALPTYTHPCINVFDLGLDEDTIALMKQTPDEGLRTLVAIKSMTGAIFDEIDDLNPLTYYWRSYLGCTVAAYSNKDQTLLDLITGNAYKNITHSAIQVVVF